MKRTGQPQSASLRSESRDCLHLSSNHRDPALSVGGGLEIESVRDPRPFHFRLLVESPRAFAKGVREAGRMYSVKSNLDTREEGIQLENCSVVACKRKQPRQAFKGRALLARFADSA